MKNIIKFIFPILLIMLTSTLFAQIPNWTWAKNLTGVSLEKCHTIEMDKSNNLYISGAYYSSSLILGTTTLSNAGNYDVFLAKYDTSGNVLWAISMGGTGMDESWDVITDYDNNVYVTGWFQSANFYFGTDTTLYNTGTGTMFLAKYDSLGNFLWARNSSGSGREWGRALGVDIANNVYLGGNFINGNITLESTTLTNQGSYDMFIAKYDSSGQVLGAIHQGGNNLELLRNMVISPEYGNIYVIGDFETSSITFDTTILYNNNPGTRDNFVVKYNSNGNFLWTKKIGGTATELGCFIAVDWKENIYVTGQFESTTCFFGTLQTNNASFSKDVYLAKYDFNGNIQWVTGMNGNNDDIVYSITSDMNDGVYICGWFDSSTLIVGSDVLSTNGNYDMFVSKFDFQGNYYWTKQNGSSLNEYAECLVSDNSGNLYVTGQFNSSSLDFDNITLANSGSDDVFIGKLAVNETSINNLSKENTSNLFYPNPAKNYIYFKEQQSIEIYSIDGKFILKDFTNKLDVSLLEKGIYLLKISDSYRKLIKE